MKFLRLLQVRESDPEKHIESPRPGYLISEDTYLVGTIKGVGRISMRPCANARSHLTT